MTKRKAIIWCAVFLVMIGTPYFTWLFMRSYCKTLDYGERNAGYTYFYKGEYHNVATIGIDDSDTAVFPTLSADNYTTFSSELDTYVSDTLPYKKLLIKLNSSLRYYLLNESLVEGTVLGKDNWLFYDQYIDEAFARWQLTDEQLTIIANNLEETRKTLAADGIEFILFLAPTKPVIYEEYTPDYYKMEHELTPTQQLINYLEENTEVKVVYPVEELLQAKEDYPDTVFYHKLDSHWNSAGGYIGAQALAKALGKELPSFGTVDLEEYTFTSSDLTNLIGIPLSSGTTDYSITSYGEDSTVLDEWEYSGLIRYHNDQATQNLIVFRDSYGSALSGPLSSVFNTSVYPMHNADIQLIYEYDADVVVFEFVERDVFKIGRMGIPDPDV